MAFILGRYVIGNPAGSGRHGCALGRAGYHMHGWNYRFDSVDIRGRMGLSGRGKKRNERNHVGPTGILFRTHTSHHLFPGEAASPPVWILRPRLHAPASDASIPVLPDLRATDDTGATVQSMVLQLLPEVPLKSSSRQPF
jgi:hypothetical protein